MRHVASEVDTLKAFPFLQNEMLLTAMKSELPNYLASSSDVTLDIDPLPWWKQHSSDLPNWTTAARLVSLVQPLPRRGHFLFCLLHLVIAKTVLCRTMLKFHLCYNIIVTLLSFTVVNDCTCLGNNY